MFHIAAQNEERDHAASDFGWSKNEDQKRTHNWNVLRDNIQNYIKGINFGYVGKMNELDIDYINAKASFKDANTVKFSYKGLFDESGKDYEIKGKNILIATGGRPR